MTVEVSLTLLCLTSRRRGQLLDANRLACKQRCLVAIGVGDVDERTDRHDYPFVVMLSRLIPPWPIVWPHST